MNEIGYEMEELIPVVGELARKYTSGESTSVSYEKAEELMEAVIFCIRELETENRAAVVLAAGRPDARRAYEMGYQIILRKTRLANEVYNEKILSFQSFGNEALTETVQKEIPRFFQKYDARFRPKETLLTLDYPVLEQLETLQGIDRIEAYLRCVFQEQTFLRAIPKEYVYHVLRAYDEEYPSLFFNLSAIVYRNLLGSMAAGKRIGIEAYTEEEMRSVCRLAEEPKDRLYQIFAGWTDILVKKLPEEEDKEELAAYLKLALPDFIAELKNAVSNDCLGAVLALGRKNQSARPGLSL